MSERHVEREQRVTPLELFFDLVFVFGFTQVTTVLSNNPTWSGLGRAQPLYGTGPVIAAAGVALLAAASDERSRAVLAASCAALAIGALAWGWSLYLRGTRVSEFAFGTLPGWPFATYVLLTIGGIALLAAGLLSGDFSNLARVANARHRHRVSRRLPALQGHPAIRLLPASHAGWAGGSLTSAAARLAPANSWRPTPIDFETTKVMLSWCG